jgi:hypothetical protein
MKKTISMSSNLLKQLESRSPKVRHQAAIQIMDLKLSGGKAALVKAISNPRNIGYTGTLVYALDAFDCSGLFNFFVDLVIFGDYEVRSTALMTLRDKPFNPTKVEIDFVLSKIEALKGDEFVIEEKDKLIYSLGFVVRRIKRSISTSKT